MKKEVKFDTNERVGVFLARRSVQHLVAIRFVFNILVSFSIYNLTL
jgi:hypothetical protein